MSKRAADSPMVNSEKQKRKRLSLSIAQKVELLQKLDRDLSVRQLSTIHNMDDAEVPRDESDFKICPSCYDKISSSFFSAHITECLKKFENVSNSYKDVSKGLSCNGCGKNLKHLNLIRQAQHIKRRRFEKSEIGGLMHELSVYGDFYNPRCSELKSNSNEKDLAEPCNEVFSCPLCGQQFSTKPKRLIHVKKCGACHNLPPSKVIAAVNFHDKQLQERVQAGLPIISFPIRKFRGLKNASERHTPSRIDPDIQVAMALSLSEHEEEEKSRKLEEEFVLESEEQSNRANFQEKLSKEDQLTMLIECPLSKKLKQGKKNAKRKKIPPLIITTPENRLNSIQARFEELIMKPDNDKLEFLPPMPENFLNPVEMLSHLKESRLAQVHSQSNNLWKMSNLSDIEDLSQFYVHSLKEIIKPCAFGDVEIGSKLKSLSQIPGRRKSTFYDEIFDEENENNFQNNQEFSYEKSEDIEENYKKTSLHNFSREMVDLKENNLQNNHEFSYDKSEDIEDLFNNKKTSSHNFSREMIDLKDLKMSSETRLIADFRSLVDSLAYSDLNIVTDGGVLVAHKTIISVRCPNMLKYIGENDEMDLSNSSYLSVKHLLVYLYSGHIECSFKDEMFSLLELAKYFDLSHLICLCNSIINERSEFSEDPISFQPDNCAKMSYIKKSASDESENNAKLESPRDSNRCRSSSIESIEEINFQMTNVTAEVNSETAAIYIQNVTPGMSISPKLTLSKNSQQNYEFNEIDYNCDITSVQDNFLQNLSPVKGSPDLFSCSSNDSELSCNSTFISLVGEVNEQLKHKGDTNSTLSTSTPVINDNASKKFKEKAGMTEEVEKIEKFKLGRNIIQSSLDQQYPDIHIKAEEMSLLSRLKSQSNFSDDSKVQSDEVAYNENLLIVENHSGTINFPEPMNFEIEEITHLDNEADTNEASSCDEQLLGFQMIKEGSKDTVEAIVTTPLSSLTERKNHKRRRKKHMEAVTTNDASSCDEQLIGSQMMKEDREYIVEAIVTTPLSSLTERKNHKKRKKKLTEAVTPLPHYSVMETPELVLNLNKYGVKKLPKKTSVKILKHIYEKIHPNSDEDEILEDKHLSCSQQVPTKMKKNLRITSSQPAVTFDKVKEIAVKHNAKSKQNKNIKEPNVKLKSSSESCEDCPSSSDQDGKNIYEESYISSQAEPCTQDESSLKNKLNKFIKRHKDLHLKILKYEPLVIENLHDELKEAGIKHSMNALIGVLDQQCITFRFNQQGRQYNKSKKKKKKN
ncbi:Structure-specific endonuclease subunit SLX4 [Nymphon striatum]|nr:Structure-specific endonuclease subunit SLX4 [Nymphon striatum]